MFFDDAEKASEELDIVLTGKDCGLEERAPMCGVPFHSCEGYIARLVNRGFKVAVCEQTEDPSTAKGLVKREVTRIITPGTVIEESMLDEDKRLGVTIKQEPKAGEVVSRYESIKVYINGDEEQNTDTETNN